MNYGPWCLKRPIQPGSGSPCVAKREKLVSSAIGDRSEQTCRLLWEAIPEAYRAGHCYTDFWAAYQAVIPEEQHRAVGKETGETARARALEEHVAATVGSVRSQNALFLKIPGDA
jgi:hypothetical protein